MYKRQTSIFGIMVEYGFKWYATKEVSQDPGRARGIAAEIFNAQLILALAATLLAALTVHWLGYPLRTVAVIAVIWVSAVLIAFTQVTRSFFRGLDMFPCDTALNLVLFLATLLALLPPLFFQPTVIAFAVAILAARVVYFAAGRLFFARKIGKISMRFSIPRGSRLLAATLAYGTQIMIFRLLLEWNTIVLHQYGGNVGVGLYQAAFRFMMATMMVSDVLLQAFFPVISRLAVSDRRRFVKTSTSLNRYLISGGAYMAGAFFLFAGELVRWVFGAAYAPAVPVLKILAFAVLGYFLTSTPAIALIALGRQGARARASAVVLAFNAAMAFILIPAMGARGAALAMVATFALYACLSYLLLFQELKRFLFDLRLLVAIMLALGGTLVTLLLKDASLLLGMAGYAALGILLFLAVTTNAEKKEMLQALRSAAVPVPEVEP